VGWATRWGNTLDVDGERPCAARLGDSGDGGDRDKRLEKEDEIEEVVSPSHSVSTASGPPVLDDEPVEQNIIHFEDGDPENPNNWRRVRVLSVSRSVVLTDNRSGRRYTPCSLQS
jgi:hypothetical protein